jgi:1L-myo-inositol 1-phosphate cytidylyltransferase / CDP-L-myo-inositol myo-inositolphosphotransferase
MAARERKRTAFRMTQPATRRLVIDARNRSWAGARPLLGLSLLRRMIRAARRSGFGNIVVLAEMDEIDRLRPLIIDEAAVAIVPALPSAKNGTVTARVPADLVGERSWLEQLAMETAVNGTRRAEGTDIFLFNAAATSEQIAAADTAPSGEPLVLETSPLRMAGESDRKSAEQRLLKGLIKDSDGFMSRYFARPISISVSRRLAPHGVTPNQMTIVSGSIGVAAAPFFLSSSPAIQLIGGLLFVAHSVLDGCDGELARLTFRESRLGGLLDFFSDNLVHVAIFACMAVGWALAEGASWPLILGASAVLGTACSAAAVYWLTLRKKTAAGPVYTSVSDRSSGRLTKVLDALSRRDFIYLVLALSVFGKANWFLALTAVGAPVFLFLVVWTATRDAQRRRALVV